MLLLVEEEELYATPCSTRGQFTWRPCWSNKLAHARAAEHRAAAETIAVQVSVAIMALSKEQALLPRYLASVDDKPSKERYLEKLERMFKWARSI